MRASAARQPPSKNYASGCGDGNLGHNGKSPNSAMIEIGPNLQALIEHALTVVGLLLAIGMTGFFYWKLRDRW
jgi:hypothetical protein